MVKKFDTSFKVAAPAGGGSGSAPTGGVDGGGKGGGSIIKAVLIIGGIVGALYLANKFIIKPMQERKRQAEENE